MLGRLLGETIELVLDLTAADATIEADRGRIEQVIVNLAVNARDAMPDGGRLSIEVTAPEIDDDYARTRLSLRAGNYVVIAVSDTGHGIDPDDQTHIFEPFFTTKPAGEGTGLGLSTVFGVVRQTGGTISVYSEPGHGSTFRIYLPRVEEPTSAETADGDASAVPTASAATVLVIDDEPPVRRIIERLLTRRGYTVLLAENGEQAVALAEQEPRPIDLLITDIVLPGHTGPEIAEQIAARRPQTKVLYTSGYPGDELSRRGLNTTAAFLGKPFTLDGLERAVSQLLEPTS
jgi:two-component system, cell cycle sensor histidine kinase and response regulator CckA